MGAPVATNGERENGEVPASLSTLIADLETLTPLRPLPAAESASQIPFSTPQTLAAPFLNHQSHDAVATVASSTPRPPSGEESSPVDDVVALENGVNSTSTMLSDILNSPHPV